MDMLDVGHDAQGGLQDHPYAKGLLELFWTNRSSINNLGLDTGCVYGGFLTAFLFPLPAGWTTGTINCVIIFQ
jgi:hypothetical protein